MDIVTRERRSLIMARIRGRDTKPELVVRRAAHGLGYRFRLHRRDLPGSPDLVFPVRQKVVFVHGCYWHRHPRCRLAYTPKSNAAFWTAKFNRNMSRDREAERHLFELGWDVLTVWECETTDHSRLKKLLRDFLQ